MDSTSLVQNFYMSMFLSIDEYKAVEFYCLVQRPLTFGDYYKTFILIMQR